MTTSLSGQVLFGHRGGIVDVYGHNLTQDVITYLDFGTVFANGLTNSSVTFTFTGSGEQSYLGFFLDGGSVKDGLMNVVYAPGTGKGSVWNLSGINLNAGTWDIQGGEVKVAGGHTLHAGRYVDENDWQTAAFSTGTVKVNNGAHALVTSSVEVADGGAYGILSGGNHSGNVVLSGSGAMMKAEVGSGSAVESGVVSGSGSLMKTGEGALVLTGDNSYTGSTTIAAGALAVGDGGRSGSLGTGAVVNNGTLAFNRSDNVSVNMEIYGTGDLVKNGAGMLTIQKPQTYTGGTTVNEGTFFF